MDSDFLLRRIHSLTGIIPVGLFLVYHLYIQLYLHSGAEAYNGVVNSYYDGPLALVLLIVFVYIPLFFHSFYGVKLSIEAQIQPEYTFFSHLLYWLQRLSGVGIFLFIFAHIWNTQIKPLADGTWGTHFEHLHEGFHDPTFGLVTISVYVFGILGATFHLANGINTFCITWGIATTPKSQARIRAVSIVTFILLTVMAFYSISAVLIS